MRRHLRGLVSLVLALILGPIAHSQSDEVAVEYFRKMEQFQDLNEWQMLEVAEVVELDSRLASDEKARIKGTLQNEIRAIQSAASELKSIYAKQYIDQTATKEEKSALVPLEANLSIAIHRELHLAAELLTVLDQRKGSIEGSHGALKLVDSMDLVAAALEQRKPVGLPLKLGLQQVLQAGRKPISTACQMVVGLCLRKSLSQLMDSLDSKNFFLVDDLRFEGIEEARQTLDQAPRSVVILIGNHDQPLYDIALGRRVALALEVDHHITMTRKSVYPIPPPTEPGDVVYVVDNDPNSNPIKESLDALRTQSRKHGRVSLAVYPEGMLPYTSGQTPMTTKEGAFVIARRISAELAAEGITTFLVEMNTNVLQHLTSVQPVEPVMKIAKVEIVPQTPLVKGQRDAWIDQRRLEAENRFNSLRGETQMNISNPTRAAHSMIPQALEQKAVDRLRGKAMLRQTGDQGRTCESLL